MRKYTLIEKQQLSELREVGEKVQLELQSTVEEANHLRQQMLTLQKEGERRNWTNLGIAKFAELIRTHQHNNADFYDALISNLVKYLNANQGQIYVTREDDTPFLELRGCYAYNKKKFISNRIEPGSGLVGQCFLEKDIILLTQVPENYIRITSGLGEALPRCVIIVPLVNESAVVGVIELASFRKFEEFEVEFVRKVAESIASAVVNIAVSERTKKLLEESQLQTEQLRAQEEEMRQNIEELAASEEEMKRLQLEAETQNRIFNSMAIVSRTDVRGNIIYVNDEFIRWSKYSREELIGKNHRILKSGHQPDEIFKEMWNTISSGQMWRGEVKNRAKDGSYYWVDAIIAPVLDSNGKPKEYISQRFVINEKKEKEELMRKLLQEIEAQTSIINSIAIVSKTNLQGEITYVNDEFVKWAGYSRAELIGKNHRILKSGQQPDEIFSGLWQTISSGKIWRGEVKNRSKDGSYYWVDAIIAPVLGEDGKPKEYIAQRFVINEMKEKEEQMKQINSEIEAQMNIINSVAIVSKTDVRGNITYVNDEFIKWSGYSRKELIGKNHRILKSGDQPDEIFSDLWQAISSGKTWRGKVKNKAKNGSFYWVDAIIAPVLDTHGKPKEYIAQRFVLEEKDVVK